MGDLARGGLPVSALKEAILATRGSPTHGYLHGLFNWVYNGLGYDRCHTDDELVKLPSGVVPFLKCFGTTLPVCSYINPSDKGIEVAHSVIESNF